MEVQSTCLHAIQHFIFNVMLLLYRHRQVKPDCITLPSGGRNDCISELLLGMSKYY